MDSTRTEIVSVWMTPEDAKRYKDNNDNYKLQMVVIDEFFEKQKKYLKTDLEALDGQVLEYRTMLLKTRQSLKEALDEHQKKAEAFWDEVWKGIPSFREKVKTLSDQLVPAINDVKTLAAAVKGIETYELERIVKITNSFAQMSSRESDMFKFLIENYKAK